MKFSGNRAFVVFGIGQVVSIFGTSLSGFALGVWVFQQTQSVAQFALVAIFVTVPNIFIRPIAGALVDRWDRRLVLIGSDSLAALLTLATIVLVWTDSLTVWYIYGMTLLQAVAAAFQIPGSSAAMQLLVPAEQFGKASGAIGATKSIATIFAPLMAGGLLATIGLEGILFIDLATFVVAATTLALISIPPIRERGSVAIASLYDEIKDGWRYVTQRRSFIILALCSMLVTAIFEMARVLLTPLVLSFTSAAVLGTITSAAGIGVLLGNIIMLVWGGPKRRTYGILGCCFVIGVSLILGGLRQSALAIGLAVMAIMIGIPMVAICIEAIWLTKVPPTLLGRVKGTTTTLESLLATLTLFASGVLADRVFEPLLTSDGLLAPTVGAIIGVGPGRGVALMLILAGMITLALVTLAALNPAVRLLEDAVPNVDVTDYLAARHETLTS